MTKKESQALWYRTNKERLLPKHLAYSRAYRLANGDRISTRERARRHIAKIRVFDEVKFLARINK